MVESPDFSSFDCVTSNLPRSLFSPGLAFSGLDGGLRGLEPSPLRAVVLRQRSLDLRCDLGLDLDSQAPLSSWERCCRPNRPPQTLRQLYPFVGLRLARGRPRLAVVTNLGGFVWFPSFPPWRRNGEKCDSSGTRQGGIRSPVKGDQEIPNLQLHLEVECMYDEMVLHNQPKQRQCN